MTSDDHLTTLANCQLNTNLDILDDSKILFFDSIEEYQTKNLSYKCPLHISTKQNIVLGTQILNFLFREEKIFKTARRFRGIHCCKSTMSSTESAYGPPLKASPLRTDCIAWRTAD